ncbi:MAG: hypothetical protein ACP5VC_03905 [Bryobacteraceae bacterium]
MKCVFALWLVLPLAASPLPRVAGESLAGQKIVLPDALGGQPAVVVWSFTREAGEKVETWAAPLVRDGVNVWVVAMIEAAPRLIRPMIRSSMRRASPALLHPRFVCATTGEKAMRQALEVADDRVPYLVLVDSGGAVGWRHAGPFSEAVHAELRRRLAELR